MFTGEEWYEFLDEGMQGLVNEAFYLLDRQEMEGEVFGDYSFVVFPLAKAYEGFVKKYLVTMGIVAEKDCKSRLFRVGKSLNPAMPKKFRDRSWAYDDLEKVCGKKGGGDAAALMWKAWRLGRNRLFHYMLGKKSQAVSLPEARERLELIVEAMRGAMKCLGASDKSRLRVAG